MYLYDVEQERIMKTSGGLSEDGQEIQDAAVVLGRRQRGMLYRPVEAEKQKPIAVVIIHASEDYSFLPICGELARRGFTALGGQVSNPGATLEEKMLDVKRAVGFLKKLPGIEKVVLLGHSGGATLMSAYQSIAENGAQIYQGEDMLVKCALDTELTPADGIMLLDSNFGNGAMTLLSIDPAVTENGNGSNLNLEYETFSVKNGFRPEGSEYREEFIKKFYKAQAKRNNDLIDLAMERLRCIESGQGAYQDDEPFFVTGGNQRKACNRMFLTDRRLLNHTKGSYPLLHANGEITEEVIYSLRPVEGGFNRTMTTFGILQTTVKGFLSEYAVRANEDYRVNPDGIQGVDWAHTFNCTPGNVTNIHAPMLIVGMTGGYEFMASEVIYQNAASKDKSIAFVEGASHGFVPETKTEQYPGQYGDTHAIVCNYAAAWLDTPGRFV